MKRRSSIYSSKHTDLNHVLAWFIALRWIACVGVLITLVVVQVGLGYPLPYRVLYLLSGLLCLVNLAFTIYHNTLKHRDLSATEMTVFLNIQIGCDYILLFFHVYFTGFLENPFSYIFVFHIMLTSFIFASRVVYIYVGSLMTLLIGACIAEYLRIIPHFPLNGTDSPAYFEMFLPRTVGLSATLAISAYLVTSIKKRLEEKGRRVEVELDRYKQLDTLKSNFILQVTHELRGPMAAMNGYHEMILRGITGEKNQRTIDVIQKANRRTDNLLTIIDEMIDYAYMKSDEKARYDRTAVGLKEVIDYQLDLVSTFAAQQNVRIVSDCAQDLQFHSNRDLLNIILTNLINNALKYSPSETTVTVRAALENHEIHLTVEDQGYGIDPDEMDRIFEEFYRARQARELERDGTGLGLPIVKRAVEALDGHITVYSEVGKGTVFHVYFPLDGGKDGKDTDHR